MIINWLKRFTLTNVTADKKEIFTPIILFILACLPFIFILNGTFVSDDWDFLTQVAGPHQPLWRYFFTNYLGGTHGGSYRPLIVWFFAAAHHLFGLHYFWYHLIQIFIHAANAVLLYLLILNFFWPAKKETRFSLAVISSLIFMILPNHSEAVAWIAAVVDPLCAFFYLACLLCLLLGLKFAKIKYWLYAGSLLLFAAAIFTKEMAMSLPFVILLFSANYFWQKKEKLIKLFIAVPYLVILAGYFWLRYRAIGLFFGYYGDEHLHLGIAKIAAVYADIITSLVLSDKLRTVFSLWLNKNLLIVFIIAILLLLAIKYFTEKKQATAWLWLIFLAMLISIVPVMNFGINLTWVYFSEEGERYGYLPSLFFAIIAATAIIFIYRKVKNKLALKISFFLIIVLAGSCLSGQLLIKNQRQAIADALAKKSLQSAAAKMQAGNYRGVLFFGLPDDYHGANIFRNGWQEAIKFYLPDAPVMLAPFSRTAYEKNKSFTVEKIDSGRYDYASADEAKLILAKPEFSSPDYSTALYNYTYEAQGSSNRYFGSRLTVMLSPELAIQKNIALFFWNGNDWNILTTN